MADFIALSRERIERALDLWLPRADVVPADLHSAMRYSALAGGKYVRPLLVYATGRAFGADLATLDGPACAVELIHAYSLIHDDLPAMDNDDLRRGKPTCHIAYGEALAILAGDALQALSFHILAVDPALLAPLALRLRMIDTLAQASSSTGMAGGQAIDLGAVGNVLALADLEDMHLRKTGALIRASVELGAFGAAIDDDAVLRKLRAYARCIGLAFQIRDDILDVEGDTAIIGKTQGADLRDNKPTYCSLLGVEGARARAEALHEEAVAQLSSFGRDADLLRNISAYIVRRIR
ncbi:MAG: polyprenyl synthetase family protein [Chromatiales bacterium]|nr:polyprenyl synthetase family protein [Chromatiales bacterium]